MTNVERTAAPAGGDAPSRRLPTTVRLLGLASLLNDVASEMIFPLLPQFVVVVLGGTKLQLGLIEGLADSTSAVLKLFSGGWSDRAGTPRASSSPATRSRRWCVR